MKKSLTIILFLLAAVQMFAQTDVTKKYIKNGSFEVNYLTYWKSTGMVMQNNASFEKEGGVYVEKWTSKGGKVGNCSISQTLTLPAGNYTLVAVAHNIQQEKDTEQTGAYLYAGDAQTPVSKYGEYRVDFTHINGDITIGFKCVNATGNYVCVDNFRLIANGEATHEAAQEPLKAAIAEATTLYGEGTGNEASVLKAVIDETQAVCDNESSTAADADAAITKLKRAALAYNMANATGNIPTVETNPYVATGGVFALGRAKITANGASITERGFCYSASNHEPTVMDSTSTYYYSHEGNIFVIEPLEPATFYWVRPYVITKGYQVAYGKPVKICTLPKSSCTWSWNQNDATPEISARCIQAVSNGIINYNECSAIQKFHLTGNYTYGAGAGGGTADCSYGGWMRISQNTTYQRTGTVQHEFAHGVGVGTSDRYADKNLHSWEWFGPRSNKLAQFLENSKEVQVVGDGTHSWVQNINGRTNKLINYGINGANEDDNTQLLYRANAMMIEAMCEDGLNPTWSYSNGISCYTFNYDESKKYYIKCEDPEFGLYDGYLYQRNSTKTGWNVFDTPSDSAAWYIEYIPSKGYYTFRNAATDKYLTHKAGATTVDVKTTKSPAATEYFQLMPSRKDVTIGAGGNTVTVPSFWLTWNDNGNKAMGLKDIGKFTGYGANFVTEFNFANSAKGQRYVIISEDELEKYNSAATAVGIKSPIVDDSESLAGNADIEGIYNVNGMKMSEAQKGVNIIKFTNGTSKKVILK